MLVFTDIVSAFLDSLVAWILSAILGLITGDPSLILR